MQPSELSGLAQFASAGRWSSKASPEPLRFDNVHSGDYNVPLQTALSTAMPLGYALQNSVDDLRVRKVDIDTRFIYGQETGEHRERLAVAAGGASG